MYKVSVLFSILNPGWLHTLKHGSVCVHCIFTADKHESETFLIFYLVSGSCDRRLANNV